MMDMYVESSPWAETLNLDCEVEEQTLNMEGEVEDRARWIVILPNGRCTIKRPGCARGTSLFHMTYVSRAMEWVNLKGAVKEWLVAIDMTEKIEQVDSITIGWRHLPSILSLIYMPKRVFCEFSIKDPNVDTGVYGCMHKRWEPYLDVDTIEHGTKGTLAHVQTADLRCIQDKTLRSLMACGLNHIPLQHTNLDEVVLELLRAWDLMADILSLDHGTYTEGACWLEKFFWKKT